MPRKATARKDQSFLQGALILTASVAAVKVVNALFKIPLMWILGAEGMGYFTSAYDLYTLLYVVATAGFPIAIARMVSANVAKRRFKDVKKIHSVSIPLFICTGIGGFLIMLGGSFVYAKVISSPGVIYSILILSPTVLFYCLISIYRGYYEGLRNMYPTAISEVVESVCKLVVGLSLSYLIYNFGMESFYNTGMVFGTAYESEALARSAVLPIASAGAIMGTTFGAFIAYLFLLIRHKIVGDKITSVELANSPRARSGRFVVKTLAKIAIPVALGAMVLNASGFVDSMLIQNRLVSIMNTNADTLTTIYNNLINERSTQIDKLHTVLYGCYGYASSVMMIVPSVTAMFGVSALPSVTAAWTEGNRRKIKSSIESVIRVTTLVTIPTGLMLTVMAKPISQLLYLTNNNYFEVDTISNVLSILGIASVFMATSTPICSMLQAVGRVDLPVKLLFIGVIVKVVINYTFVSIPQINIGGAGAGTLICYMIITTMALFLLCRETRILPNLMSVFLKPLIASICCVASAFIIHNLLAVLVNHRIATLAAMAVAGAVYVVSLFLFRAITKSDILMLPKGKKIVKVLAKYKILR